MRLDMRINSKINTSHKGEVQVQINISLPEFLEIYDLIAKSNLSICQKLHSSLDNAIKIPKIC